MTEQGNTGAGDVRLALSFRNVGSFPAPYVYPPNVSGGDGGRGTSQSSLPGGGSAVVVLQSPQGPVVTGGTRESLPGGRTRVFWPRIARGAGARRERFLFIGSFSLKWLDMLHPAFLIAV